MKHWRLKLDFTFVVVIALTAIIALCGCKPQETAEEQATLSFESTVQATTEETTQPATEPNETEPPVTEPPASPSTEPTQPVETEPPVTLYDVPLDADLQLHIIETAQTHDIDPSIVFAMAWIESTYNPDNVGDSGASLGLLQIQPRWHSARMEKLGCSDLFDPYQNVIVGVDYLSELLANYGDMGAALTAYNRGHYNGTVTDYAWAVMNKADSLSKTTYEVYL